MCFRVKATWHGSIRICFIDNWYTIPASKDRLLGTAKRRISLEEECRLKNITAYFKDVLYSILAPDPVGLTVAVWIRALNVNFSIFCALLYQTSLSCDTRQNRMMSSREKLPSLQWYIVLLSQLTSFVNAWAGRRTQLHGPGRPP